MNAMVPTGPFILDNLLWKAEHLVCPWMAERIEMMGPSESFGPCSAIGVVHDDAIVGGVVYSHWFPNPEGGDCQVSMVMEPGARVTRRMWRHLYGHGFVTMNCRRMSLQILKKNRKARRHVEDAGFRVEGCKPEGHGKHDIIFYGLLRSQLRDGLPPLRKVRHHG